MRRSVIVPMLLAIACSDATPPEPRPDRLTIMPESIALPIGGQVLIQAATVPATPVIRFSVSNPSVATIDDRGIVTARDFGSTFVVAEAGSLRDSAIVAVPRPTIDLSPDSVTIRIGQQGIVLHNHTHGSTPQVSSMDPAVARVAIDPMNPKQGRWLVTGVSVGTTFMVASSTNGPLTVTDSTRVVVLP